MNEGFTGGMMIAVAEARTACKDEPDITERVKKAMKVCHNHWMETNETNQFRSALAAAMLESEDEVEKDRIGRSSRALNKLSAMLSALQAGVPVDVEAMAAEKRDEDLLPLMDLWYDRQKAVDPVG